MAEKASMATTSTLVKCASCGRRSDQRTRFCVDCGTPLAQPYPSAGPTVPHFEDVATKTPTLWADRSANAPPAARAAERRVPPIEPPPVAPPPPAGRPDRPILIGIGVAALLVLVVLAAALYVGGVFGSTSSSGTTTILSSQNPPSTPATTTPNPAATSPGAAQPNASPPSSPSTEPSGAQPAGATNTYSGQAFSIQYPAAWTVKSAEQHHAYGSDTTIVSATDPNTLLRVDVTTNPTTSNPLSAAQPVINALAQQSGYRQLDLTAGTFEGYPAEHWEFLVKESGVLLHKEDEFFTDTANGDSVAILTQAPAGQYRALANQLSTLRQTLSMD
jgi:hypothetical protein